MDKIISFITEHLFLVSLFFVTLVMLLVEEFRVKGALDPSDAAIMLQKNGRIFDLRDEAAYNQSHIEGSVHVKNREKAKWEKWHGESAIILICQDGKLSKDTLQEIAQLNLKNIYFVEGGLSAWKKDGFHVSSLEKKS